MGVTTCIFQQFNPSTLKAQYNAAEDKKKAILWEIAMSCSHCEDGTMPYAFDITFSDFVDIDCCYISKFQSDGFIGVDDALNGNTFKIHYQEPCIYETPSCGLAGSYGLWKYYYDVDCTQLGGQSAFLKLFIRITLTATGFDIQVDIGHGSPTLPCWHQHSVFCGSAICSCDGIDETVTNDITSCYDLICPTFENTPDPGIKIEHPCGSSGQLQVVGLYC